MGKSSIKILGVDPGSQLCGYAFISTNQPHIVSRRSIRFEDIGVLKADKSLSLVDRLAGLHDALYELVCLHQPDVCVMEDAFLGLNARSALKLGQARGVLMTAVFRCQIPLEEVTPTFVKKTIVGHGLADKEQVSQALKHLVGFDRGLLPHDCSDALAIALSYCYTGAATSLMEKLAALSKDGVAQTV